MKSLIIGFKRFRKKLKRKRLKQIKKRKNLETNLKLRSKFTKTITYFDLLNRYLPVNLKYLISNTNSRFLINPKDIPKNKGIFKVPKEFSLIDNPNESFIFLCQLTSALIHQSYIEIKIDYGSCERVDLGAQVLLDIILKDTISFYKKCQLFGHAKVKSIEGANMKNADIRKMLYSVGSQAIHINKKIVYPDYSTL